MPLERVTFNPREFPRVGILIFFPPLGGDGVHRMLAQLLAELLEQQNSLFSSLEAELCWVLLIFGIKEGGRATRGRECSLGVCAKPGGFTLKNPSPAPSHLLPL